MFYMLTFFRKQSIAISYSSDYINFFLSYIQVVLNEKYLILYSILICESTTDIDLAFNII